MPNIHKMNRSAFKPIRFLALVAAFATVASAESASAATGNACWFGAPLASYSLPLCNEEFRFDPVLDKNLTISTYPTAGNGYVQFSVDEDLDFMVDVIFQPSAGKSLFTSLVDNEGVFEYNLAITAPGQVFDQVRLSSTTSSPFAVVRKTILSDTPTLVLESEGATAAQAAFSNRGLTFIQVRDTYSVSGGSLRGFQNAYTQTDATDPETTVPGPLPLFGAGAAFGFSRRIRRRIGTQNKAAGCNGNS